ncbi:MAG: radical SAM protein [Victivallaceae bacterium]
MSDKLDLLLINPGGTRKAVYQDLSKVFSAIDTPFWAALTAGFLRGKGFRVAILDANAENLDFDETAAAVRRAAPRFAAVVCYSQQANVCAPIMVAVNALCRKLKEELPDQPVVLSGWHPSALPERSLEESGADCVLCGEGFYGFEKLLGGVPPEAVPGLCYRSGMEIRINPRAANVADLSAELPDVAWDLLPMDQYRAFSWMCLRDFSERTKFASLFTSLGCPYHCKFCAIHSTYGEHKLRAWSPEWVLKQLDILVGTYGVKHINLHDELFVFDPRHYRPIAEGIIARGYELNINAFARVDVLAKISDADLALLKRAGFHWLKLGIETGSKHIRANVGKDSYDLDTVRRAVGRAHAAGIDFCANFMFGLPGDDYESMQSTLNLALELLPAFPSFFCTMAIPGSELYQEALLAGVKLPDTWLGYASQGYDFLPLPTEHLTARQVLEFRDYAFDVYFKNPRFLHMIETKFGPAAREHLEQMTAIKLKRKLLGD